MSEITRDEISLAMQQAVVDGETAEDRNAQRRAAVEEFLASQPNGAGLQGSVHDMIMSDLESYKEWEDDAAKAALRAQHHAYPPWRR